MRKPWGNDTSAIPFTLPASVPDDSAGGHGGGYGAQPTTLLRRAIGAPFGTFNPGLSNWKAFHYGESPLPGRHYQAFIPVYSFSEWLR